MAHFVCEEAFGNETNYTAEEIRLALVEFEHELLLYKLPCFIYLTLLILIGAPGNICVCFIYISKFPQSTPRLFIVALALFDLLNCLVGMPFDIADLTTDYFLDVAAICKIVRFCNTFSACGSMLVLTAISVDRYQKICRPLRKQMLLRVAKKCVVGIVILAAAFSAPAFIVYGRHTFDIHGLVTADCSFDDVYGHSDFSKFYEAALGLMCFAGIILMAVLYTLIVLKIVKQKRRRATLTSDGANLTSRQNSNNSARIDKDPGVPPRKFTRSISANGTHSGRKNKKGYVRSSRMTMMMLIVTIAFIIGYMPHVGLQITRISIKHFSDTVRCDKVATALYQLFLRSYFLNSAINPIIYSYFNKRFRHQVRALLRKLFCMSDEAVNVISVNATES